MKKIFIGLLLSGCAQTGNGPSLNDNYYNRPDQIKCPEGTVAYSEGRSTTSLECTCINSRDLNTIVEQLQGIR